MKILIVGSGLIGLSSAQVLLDRGHEVEILEALEDVGLETSYANGGMLTASMSDPWNSPGVHKHLFSSLFNRQSAMKIRLHAIPSLFTWGLRFLYHSSKVRHQLATNANYNLATYAIRKTLELKERFGLKYDAVEHGTLRLFRGKASMSEALAIAEQLSKLGLRFVILDAAAAIEREPHLASIADDIAGALWYPDDITGDAHMFCQELNRLVNKQGGTVHTGVSVKNFNLNKNSITGVSTNRGIFSADKVIVSAGSHTPALLRKIGLSLPVKPVKGYSVTLTIPDTDLPHIPVIDDVMHAAISPLGNKLRLVGTAEFTGFDKRIREERIDSLFNLLENIYPHISSRIDRKHATSWAGLRPISCDGKPYIGITKYSELYINTGHGHLGWTMAMGSAHLLADQIEGKFSEIDQVPFYACR